ncbi:MAG: M23 family metallopeptidase [Cyanobacteriota bacterium]|nr:M23 family metallopeptidase [Cyanobacteriota bacterium]
MPSACSDRPRRQPGRRWLALGAVAAIAASQAPRPSPANLAATWGRGSFPVASFMGFTSPFGWRVHPLSGGLRPHEGLDIAAPLGSPVRNWWGGILVEVLRDSGCGNGLLIRSGAYEHLYCHLGGQVEGSTYRSGSVVLRVGQGLRTGQTIGHVGLSGSTTGPHLHWGLRYGDRWLDPAAVLRAMAADRRRQQTSWRGAFNVRPTW